MREHKKAVDYVGNFISMGFCPYSENIIGTGTKQPEYSCQHLDCQVLDKVHKLAFDDRCTLADMKKCHFTSPVDFDRIKGG